MSDLGFLPFLFTSHNKHIEKVIYNKVFSGRLEGLLNHYRCTTKAIIYLSPVLSYIKPLRVSPARIRTLLEVSMCNHLLNNIVTAVGGWHVAKQTYLVTLVTFTVCTLVSFRRARASAGGGGRGEAWTTRQEGRKEGEKRSVAHTDLPHLPRACPRSPEKREKNNGNSADYTNGCFVGYKK